MRRDGCGSFNADDTLYALPMLGRRRAGRLHGRRRFMKTGFLDKGHAHF